jgi:hypothetical protein
MKSTIKVETSVRSSQTDEGRRKLLRKRSKAASKTSYVCPNCVLVRVWGRPGLPIGCRSCDVALEAAARPMWSILDMSPDDGDST